MRNSSVDKRMKVEIVIKKENAEVSDNKKRERKMQKCFQRIKNMKEYENNLSKFNFFFTFWVNIPLSFPYYQSQFKTVIVYEEYSLFSFFSLILIMDSKEVYQELG